MGIVKADAYGHGDVECTRELERCGVDFFAVSSVDEGVHLREHGIRSAILILGYTPPEHFHYLHELRLTQTLVDLPFARKLDAYAHAHDCVIEAHVKADTGMSRIGVIVQDHAYHIEEILEMYAMKHVRVTGIFSHFSVSDSHTAEDLAFTKHQIELFERVLADIRAAGFDCGVRHLQNSYGILNYPDLQYDYVRPGLLYMGVTSDDEIPINTAPGFSSDLIAACQCDDGQDHCGRRERKLWPSFSRAMPDPGGQRVDRLCGWHPAPAFQHRL